MIFRLKFPSSLQSPFSNATISLVPWRRCVDSPSFKKQQAMLMATNYLLPTVHLKRTTRVTLANAVRFAALLTIRIVTHTRPFPTWIRTESISLTALSSLLVMKPFTRRVPTFQQRDGERLNESVERLHSYYKCNLYCIHFSLESLGAVGRYGFVVDRE